MSLSLLHFIIYPNQTALDLLRRSVGVYTRFLLLSPYVMFSFSLLRLWFCYYYTISFCLLPNVYGYSSFHVYPITYLILINYSWSWLFLIIYQSAIFLLTAI